MKEKNKRIAFLGVLIALVAGNAYYQPFDSIITQDNIFETICDGPSGWTTDLVRPANTVTTRIKKRMMAEIKTKLPSSAFQLDHIVPLTIGGAPLQPNLQLQPIAEARKKDVYEKYLWGQVCDEEIMLKEAQERISTDWLSFYLEAGLDKKLGGSVTDIDDI